MNYQYALEILAEDGRQLDRVVVTPDWKPALEWVRFEGIREGRLRPVTAAVPGAIEPIWDDQVGEPIVGAFRAVVRSEVGDEVSREIPKIYLRSFAQQAAARLVARGVLQAGDAFRYAISAFAAPSGTMADEPQAAGFAVEEIVEPMPLVDVPLHYLLSRALSVGSEAVGSDHLAGHLPVFLPRRILDETVEAAQQAGDVETGGVLVGRLCRDSAARGKSGTAPEIFVEVTAQIPAPHTLSQSTRLTFTAETWAAVQAAITLRRRDELMLGWWHFHPDFCRLRNCPVERRARCTGASPFFSAEDVHLHATCFSSAYHVALLISDSTAAGGMTWSLYGWLQGMVAARGFHVLTDEHQVICNHQVAGGQETAGDHQEATKGVSHATHTAPGS